MTQFARLEREMNKLTRATVKNRLKVSASRPARASGKRNAALDNSTAKYFDAIVKLAKS